MANKSKKGPVFAGKVKDRPSITVYVDPELLAHVDKLRLIENRSRGNMALEIMRRYFAAEEEKKDAAASQ